LTLFLNLDSPIPRTQRKNDRGKKTLVLDIDETLVHTTQEPLVKSTNSFRINWLFEEENTISIAYTCLRPGIHKFLQKASKMFEVVLFTASRPLYAKAVVKLFDKDGKIPYLL
jgi:TFIIF-interacting CTD phosphatase-like protein